MKKLETQLADHKAHRKELVDLQTDYSSRLKNANTKLEDAIDARTNLPLESLTDDSYMAKLSTEIRALEDNVIRLELIVTRTNRDIELTDSEILSVGSEIAKEWAEGQKDVLQAQIISYNDAKNALEVEAQKINVTLDAARNKGVRLTRGSNIDIGKIPTVHWFGNMLVVDLDYKSRKKLEAQEGNSPEMQANLDAIMARAKKAAGAKS